MIRMADQKIIDELNEVAEAARALGGYAEVTAAYIEAYARMRAAVIEKGYYVGPQ